MSEKKRMSGLGRGLSALLEEIDLANTVRPEEEAGEPGSGAPSLTLPLSRIVANPRQPRRHFDPAALDELVSSIRERGLLQPILVRPTSGDRYEIVAGERRWRAAQAAQLHEVPVIIRELDDGVAFEIALVENIQRADLNPIEEAQAYQRLMREYGHTQEALGRLVGKSRSHVANLLRLLDLPPSVSQLVLDGRLTMGHARALLSAPDPVALAEKVVAEGLSVRQTEALASRREQPAAPGASRPSAAAAKDPDIMALERQLSETLGLSVSVDHRGPGGAITVAYSSLDQLDMICQRLSAGRHF